MKGSVVYGVHAGVLKRLTALILIILACMSAAAGAGQSFDVAPGTILRLIEDLDTQEYPAIDGDYIVWNHVSEDSPTIVVYTITTGETTDIPVYNEGRRQPPQISGDYIVWTDGRSAGSPRDDQAVYLYTISTGELRKISSEAAKPENPEISGDYVVWQDSREKGGDSSRDIYLYHIPTGEETAICTAPHDQRGPRIWEDRVLWTDMRNGNADIYLYSIRTGEETAFITDPGDQSASDLSGDQVLWTDAESGELRLSNITGGTERVVSAESSWKMGASLYGDRVVWVDSAFRGNDIPDNDLHLFNLTGEKEMLVYPSRYHSQGRPSISGDRIVWEDIGDIWLFSYEPGGSPPPAQKTPGFAATVAILSSSIFLLAWRRVTGR